MLPFFYLPVDYIETKTVKLLIYLLYYSDDINLVITGSRMALHTSVETSEGLIDNQKNPNNIVSDATKSNLHEYEINRKTYPKRNNRTKLNYRDLQRGMYGDMYESMHSRCNSNRPQQKYETIDLSLDDDDDDNDEQDPLFLCYKLKDDKKSMLQCSSCANCDEVTQNHQASVSKRTRNSAICPSCQDISRPVLQSTKSCDVSVATQRKHSDLVYQNSKIKQCRVLVECLSQDESTKRFKTESFTKNENYCIVRTCENPSKFGWIYCSSACIRRHINDTLQAIQRSQGTTNEHIPTRSDILLYDNKSKQTLDTNSVPEIEDLCVWLNQHPTYELRRSSSNQSKDSIQSSSSSSVNTKKFKLSSLSNVTQQQSIKSKSILPKKKTVKALKVTKTSTDPTADIRCKVPIALYDKIIMRLEKNGEQSLINDDIRTLVYQIEEEMYTVYGKVDNSYKNKFRSLLANVSNMTNNFFYKRIISKEITAKQIVSMKAEDMLPPEVKEKRKDQFEKEVQMIMKAEQQKAEELARRARAKTNRSDLIDTYSFAPTFTAKEQSPSKEKVTETIDEQPVNASMTKDQHDLPVSPVIPLPTAPVSKAVDSSTTVKFSSSLPVLDKNHIVCSENDSDNDYIDPESPTGADALIYDEDEDEDEDENVGESGDDTVFINDNCFQSSVSCQPMHLENYNPLQTGMQTSSTSQSEPYSDLQHQWRGMICSTDGQIPCRSVHAYGDSNHLINHIPEQLIVIGRLRLTDLWDYVQESIFIRDVLILTLTSSSSLNPRNNDLFLQYIDTIQTTRRAAVISKYTKASHIRDMYILPADTKDCPTSVISSLFLPTTFEAKQLFLVAIGSARKTPKSVVYLNDYLSVNHFTYKPIALQDETVTRDPRLTKSRDPRLNKSNAINENVALSATVTADDTAKYSQYTNDELLNLTSGALELIRHSSTIKNMHSIVASTSEILKANQRVDLHNSFLNDYVMILAERQKTYENALSPPITVPGDNLVEEKMDVVDDDQDTKEQEQLLPSNTNQSLPSNDQPRKPRQKSRFSDILPTDAHLFEKPQLNAGLQKLDKNFAADNMKLPQIKYTNKPILPVNSLTSTEKRPHFGGNLSLRNNNAMKSIRSTPTFDPAMQQQQQQKSKNRYSNQQKKRNFKIESSSSHVQGRNMSAGIYPNRQHFDNLSYISDGRDRISYVNDPCAPSLHGVALDRNSVVLRPSELNRDRNPIYSYRSGQENIYGYNNAAFSDISGADSRNPSVRSPRTDLYALQKVFETPKNKGKASRICSKYWYIFVILTLIILVALGVGIGLGVFYAKNKAKQCHLSCAPHEQLIHLNSTHCECQYIDKCETEPEICHPFACITNNETGYACQCTAGFQHPPINNDLTQCHDINECEIPNICSENQICNNTDGSYFCSCKPGYESISTSNGTECRDIDECLNGSRCSNGYCVNNNGSFSCKCLPGFIPDIFHPWHCEDFDECSSSNNCTGINEICNNTLGSYQCICAQGYRRDANGHCMNINECEELSAACDTNSRCEDRNGSFACCMKTITNECIECGYDYSNASSVVGNHVRRTRMIDGQPVAAGHFPWVAALLIRHEYYNSEPRYVCAASLVSSWNLITAAHCLDETHFRKEWNLTTYPSSFKDIFDIRIGVHNLSLNSTEFLNSQSYSIANFTSHKDYEPLDSEHAVVKNDVALIKLTKRIERSVNNDWLCLPTKVNVYDQDILKVVSYSNTEDQSIKQQLNVRALDNPQTQNECQRQLNNIAEDAFCAISVNDSSFLGLGDSGAGATLLTTNHRWQLAGVMSKTGVQKAYSAMTNVSMHIDWLQSLVER
ncbi:unnamed protein product [Adineta ricciae]|uniref:Uncharacterized protein n=1 Tax=Adineta ricciae TaxID=249248 RepID=A0A813W3G4_ADIRI|nr:unnamed protein product [Adineta ricciae]